MVSAVWRVDWRGEAVVGQVRSSIRGAMLSVGADAVAEARSRAPVRTGALRDDIEFVMDGDDSGSLGTRNLRYGLIQEIRVGFIRSAADSVFPSLADRIQGI